MSALQVVEKWYVDNRQRLSAQSLQVNMGKTPDDGSEGWTWLKIESESKIMQIRISNGLRIESVLWNERTSEETILADREIGNDEDLGVTLSQHLAAFLGE